MYNLEKANLERMIIENLEYLDHLEDKARKLNIPVSEFLTYMDILDAQTVLLQHYFTAFQRPPDNDPLTT